MPRRFCVCASLRWKANSISRAAIFSQSGASCAVSSTAAFTSASSAAPVSMPGLIKPTAFAHSAVKG